MWPSLSRIERPSAVAARLRNGEPAGRDDDGVGLERRRALALDAPASGRSARARSRACPSGASTPRRRARASSASRTSRARLEAGKSLPGLRLLGERDAELALEERDLLAQRPGAEHSLQRVGRGVGDEARLVGAATGRTLHRPPPLIRILRPPSGVRSRRSVSASADAAKIAAIVPAAPAPMIGDASAPRSHAATIIGTVGRFALAAVETDMVRRPVGGAGRSARSGRWGRLTYASFAPRAASSRPMGWPGGPPGGRGGSLGLN